MIVKIWVKDKDLGVLVQSKGIVFSIMDYLGLQVIQGGKIESRLEYRRFLMFIGEEDEVNLIQMVEKEQLISQEEEESVFFQRVSEERVLRGNSQLVNIISRWGLLGYFYFEFIYLFFNRWEVFMCYLFFYCWY